MKVWTLGSDEGVTLAFKNTEDLLDTLRFALTGEGIPETRRWTIGQRQVTEAEWEQLPTPGSPRR